MMPQIPAQQGCGEPPRGVGCAPPLQAPCPPGPPIGMPPVAPPCMPMAQPMALPPLTMGQTGCPESPRQGCIGLPPAPPPCSPPPRAPPAPCPPPRAPPSSKCCPAPACCKKSHKSH